MLKPAFLLLASLALLGACQSPVRPAATPTAQATSDSSSVQRTSFGGRVTDKTGQALTEVEIQAESLNTSVPYSDKTQTTYGGAYAFQGAPVGIQIKITASTKSGGLNQSRTEVLKINSSGDPSVNQVDFTF